MNAFLLFFVKQKKLALLFTLSVVILGFMTLQKIQRDTYPVIEFDRLSINTSYPSASPRDVEKNITNVIENKIKGIYGIKELTSTSSEGSSRINIEIEENVDDIQSVKDSISEAVNEIEDLPEDVFPDRPWCKGNNGKTAVKEFLKTHPEFEIDKQFNDKLVINTSPDGYLKRVG